MARPPSAETDQDALAAVVAPFLRRLYAVLMLVCALGVGFALALPRPLQTQASLLMALGYGVLGLLCWAGWRAPARRAQALLAAVLLCGLFVLALVSLGSGWGLLIPGLALSSLAVFVAHLAGPPGLGRLVTGLTAVMLAGLGLAEAQGWWGLRTPAGVPPLGSRLALQLAAVAAGALLGQAMKQVLHQHLQAVRARESRFLTLLGMAAGAYWETDPSGCLTQLSRRDGHGPFALVGAGIGQPVWASMAWQFNAEAAAQLRNALGQCQALADLPLHWRQADGGQRHGLLSGEPRHDAQGRVIGYWGIVRDVSAEQQARLALSQTEWRYRDLFNRIPTALLVHSQGRVIEANAAAARLLGYPTQQPLIGQALLARHVCSDDHARAQQHLDAAAQLPAGSEMAPADLNLLTLRGRALQIRALTVRTDHPGQAALLTICIDESAQRAAAQALERSKALLSQVVTLSPDIITLSDLDTGRYVMVNDSFCRLLGWQRSEAEGRTSTDLGLWRDLTDRAELVQAIERDGLVQDRLIPFVTREGQELPLLISGVRFDSEGQRYLLLNGRDQTETQRVQQEQAAVLTHASVGIAFTRDRRFVLANARFEAMYCWPRGGLAGLPIDALWSDQAHFQALQQAVAAPLARGEAIDIERQGQRRDGSSFRVRLRAQAVDPVKPTVSGTIWVVEDVTRAHQAEQDLAQARDAAEAANRAKSAFLANTSHEIRTPLNGVLALARLARDPGLTPERRQRYLDQIHDSAQLLNGILTDILDVAKIEAGKITLESAAFDLGALLGALQQAYAALASSQGLGFTLQADPALPAWVLGDALRVRQILGNFLQNALKFCATGEVRLLARAEPEGWVRFEVHDTGPGIAPEVQARLFQPFAQADQSINRQYGGTGLGLAIARDLARLMGGEVGLRSAPGMGSCFHARLPLAATAPDDRPALTPAAQGRLAGKRVLLVEDNPVNLMIGVAVLEQWGVQVVQAVDGPTALWAAEQAAANGQPLQAVLMDLQMPGMSGHDTAQALRQHHGQLPVIALTAAALVSERERALASGMRDFLTKPLDPERLYAALCKVMAAP